MPIDPSAVGREGAPRTRSWTSTDALLYAVGVGAGLGEPTSELAFTTENSDGVPQQVLPTFAVLLSQAPPPSFGTFDPARLVHAEQAITLHRPVPVEGTVTATARVVGVHDKGSGALVVTESEAVLADGSPLATNRTALFIRGEGGFGGDRGPRDDWTAPDRAPDRFRETDPARAVHLRRRRAGADPRGRRRRSHPDHRDVRAVQRRRRAGPGTHRRDLGGRRGRGGPVPHPYRRRDGGHRPWPRHCRPRLTPTTTNRGDRTVTGDLVLAGRVVVVTGSGRGLGRAYALAVAAAGAAVVVNDVDAAAADAVVAEIAAAGGRAVPVVAPVGPTATADALVAAAVEHYGQLDAVVTNAGLLRDRSVGKMTDEDFDLVLETHLRGTFTCARAALARFRQQGGGGRLVLIGSPAGQRASFGQTNYSAAKAGIVGMARTLAVEAARYDVTVNALIPVALTRMVATIPAFADAVAAVEAGEPVPARLRAAGVGTADDVAPLLVYLLSDAAAGVTGQALGVGGDRISVWTHPTVAAETSREGGWTAEAIAEVFPEQLAPHLQPYAPDVPAEAR
jgi:NAD(P)-dependent dehydrogenase (short-subunit alcohol dehydrogenase family)